jgi:uracil-DNA glycosylase
MTRTAPPATRKSPGSLDRLLDDIRACRICRDTTTVTPLPHDPRPVVRASVSAQILIAGQAPGVRVHRSGLPFDDPSGDRLRVWMGVTREEFYDTRRIAIAPMGFCFPGLDAAGGDLPPRKECAPQWRAALMSELPDVRLILVIGGYAQRWHLGREAARTITETVRDYRRIASLPGCVTRIALPHPSWRNSGWLKSNPWFGTDVVPDLRRRVRAILGPS